jgi:putative peptide zinc metalloprotease protein
LLPQNLESPIPLLKTGIRFSTFEEAASTRGRYLVEAGATCFAVSEEMYHLLQAVSERPSTLEELAAAVYARTGQQFEPEALAEMLAGAIPPAMRADSPDSVRKTPFLASVRLLSARAVRPFTSRMTWLFTKYVSAVLLTLFAVVAVLSFRPATSAIYSTFTGKELILLYAGIALVGLIHELGHATACYRYGCEHGDIGFGLYYIFPAFYADVTKAWRLTSRQRAVIDLGGLYFNAVMLIPLGTWALASGNRVALRLVWLIFLIMIQNLNPVFKLDGYWLFSDLSGLTNLHDRMADGIGRFGRRLLGRARPEDARQTGLRGGLLRLYIALVAVYTVFIVDFLVRSLRGIASTYPARAGQALHALVQGFHLSAWGEVTLGTWRLLALSFWPLLLCAALLSLGFKVFGRARRFVGELGS